MNTTSPPTSQQYTDEEIRQAIIEQAKKDLEELNPDFLIGWSPTGGIPKPDGNIKFGDLPAEVQEGIRQGLESAARGESTRWEFDIS